MKKAFVKNILKVLEKNGFEAYLVGGSVRDELLGRSTNDFDIATNALPADLIKLFGAPSKAVSYGSYRLMKNGIHVDITTYRIEEDYTNRHPKIRYSNSLIEDAKRRDFTMNAIYVNRQNQIIDLYHGQEHLRQHKIVCIGNPLDKFREDPLRILRAIRFSSVLHLTLDPLVKEAIFATKEGLLTLSLNRIKEELDKIFLANGFSLLKEFQLDELLQLDLSNVVYVPDLSGLWAQIKTNQEYPLEKEIKNNIKKIHNILKCGTIRVDDIYRDGLYVCFICADLLHIDRTVIDKLAKKMPIQSRKDLKIKGNEIQNYTHCKESEIHGLLHEIELMVLHGTLKNKKKAILKELERRSTHANA